MMTTDLPRTDGFCFDVVVDRSQLPTVQALMRLRQQMAAGGPPVGSGPDVLMLRVCGSGDAELLDSLRRVFGADVADLTLLDVADVLSITAGVGYVLPGQNRLRFDTGGSQFTLEYQRLAVRDDGGKYPPLAARWPDVGNTAAHVLLDTAAIGAILRTYCIPEPWPQATTTDMQNVAERSGRVDRMHAANAPTNVLQAVLSVTDSNPHHTGRQVRNADTAAIRRKTRGGLAAGDAGGEISVQLMGGSQLFLDVDTFPAGTDDAVCLQAGLQQLARTFDDDTLRTLLALVLLRDADGVVLENYQNLAGLMGWTPESLVAHGNRRNKRLRSSVDTLMTVRFLISNTNVTVARRLVVEVGEVQTKRPRKRKQRLLEFTKAIWGPLTRAGLVTAFDRRLLRVSEPAMRLGLYLATRLGPSYATNYLDKHNGLPHTLATLLDGAGVKWRDGVKKHGPAALRAKVQGWLDELHAAPDGGPPLWFEYQQRDAIGDDLITVWYGPHLLAEQDSVSSKRRLARDRRTGTAAAKGLPAPQTKDTPT